MKRLITLLLLLAGMFFASSHALATGKATATITTVIQKDKTIEVTIISSQPFIVGDNAYVLYIGSKSYAHSRQRTIHSKGVIVFFIPEGDFNTLEDGAFSCIAYGHIFKGMEDRIETLYMGQGYKCTPLGKFNKSLLQH